MKNHDFSIPITLAGKQYFLRNDHNSKCTIQKTLGGELRKGIFLTALGVRATLYGMLGRMTEAGKFVHLSATGEITLDECGEFFDTESPDMLVEKIGEAFEASNPERKAKEEKEPSPKAHRLERTGAHSSDLPAVSQ